MVKKKTISDAQLSAELMKLFEGGQTGKWGKTGTYGKIREHFTAAKNRFDKIYDSTIKEWQILKQKAASEQIQANTAEGLKQGLKSKTERQLELEKMLQPDYFAEIAAFDLKSGQLLKGNRKLSPTEILAIHAELSKMNGDYAPNKVVSDNKHSMEITVGYESVDED